MAEAVASGVGDLCSWLHSMNRRKLFNLSKPLGHLYPIKGHDSFNKYLLSWGPLCACEKKKKKKKQTRGREKADKK